MKKGILILSVMIAVFGYYQVTHAQNIGTVNEKDINNSLPFADRDYFDGCGNKFDYLGNLKEKGNGCKPKSPHRENGFRPPVFKGK